MSKYLAPHEFAVDTRTTAQQNFDTLEGKAFYARPNPGAGVGPPTTGTWEEDELYTDSTRTVWRCTVGGTPGTWTIHSVSGAEPNQVHIHYQVTPAATWPIDHNLGHYPVIKVLDSTGQTQEMGEDHTTLDHVDLTSTAAFSGIAVLM